MATTLLAWEQDPATPPADSWIITVMQAGKPDQMFRVARATPEACQALPGATPLTYCAQIACPAPETLTRVTMVASSICLYQSLLPLRSCLWPVVCPIFISASLSVCRCYNPTV